MKRFTVTIITVLALALVPLAFAQADEDDADNRYPGYGWGGHRGPGMMGGGYGGGMIGGGYGAGHGGMMGGGYGGGMMNPRMLPFYNELTPEQRQQIDSLHLGVAQQMLVERAKVSGLMLALQQDMHKFPVDQAAAGKTFAEIQQAQGGMFKLMQGSMASMQKIIGKDRWEELQAFHNGHMQGYWGRGPGQPGAGGMMQGRSMPR